MHLPIIIISIILHIIRLLSAYLIINCMCRNCMMSVIFIFNQPVQNWKFLGARQIPGSIAPY